MHFSLMCLMGQDLIPFGTLGFGVSAILILIGLMIQGNILGTFAEIVFEINEISILSQS